MNPFNPPTDSVRRARCMFGVHVRVHPGFWIFSGLFGYFTGLCQNFKGEIVWESIFAWIACTFFSVLFHELGHVIVGRMCGEKGNIVLHSFGGAAVGQYQLCRNWQQMAIALAGPAAGLLLFGIVWVLTQPFSLAPFGMPDVHGPLLLTKLDPAKAHGWLTRAVKFLLLMTFMWNVMNLIPVIPMDGGQVMRAAPGGDKWPSGLRLALGMSALIAGFVAVYSFMAHNRKDLWYPEIPTWVSVDLPGGARLDPLFLVIIFGIMALQNFITMLQVRRPRPAVEAEPPPQEEYPDLRREY